MQTIKTSKYYAHKRNIFVATIALLTLAGLISVASLFTHRALAATTITVNSTADTVANDGACTLREAIIASNTDTTSGAAVGECPAGSGNDIIEFNITGAADFTNGGQDGYTISPTSDLPSITETVSINGYSQPGSSANSTVSPQPFDAVILVELTGANMPADSGPGLLIQDEGSDSTEVRGLVINQFKSDGIQVSGVDDVQIKGNYIGTDYTGMSDLGNGSQYTSGEYQGNGVVLNYSNRTLIGGADSAARNIISSNRTGDIYVEDEQDQPNGSSSNEIKGNYIGTASDGTTALPAGHAYGLGNAMLLGHSFNDVIGGTEEGAANVIGSSYEFGIGFRDGCAGQVIQGNFIGTDYTGTQTMTHALGTGHISGGIHVGTVTNAGFTRITSNITIGGTTPEARNIISGNSSSTPDSFKPYGISIDEEAHDVVVQGNHIGVDSTGLLDLGHQGTGLAFASGAHDNLLGGSTAGARNIISGNGEDTNYKGVQLSSSPDNTIQGNYIGVGSDGSTAIPNAIGISVDDSSPGTQIGGVNSGEGNVVSGNSNDGFVLGSNTTIQGNIIGLSLDVSTAVPNDNGISIYGPGGNNNLVGGNVSGARNIIAGNSSDGINMYTGDTGTVGNTIIGNSIYDNEEIGIDLGGDGVTVNDELDVDSGSNDLLNFPRYYNVFEASGNTTVDYSLDVPAGNYRIEFFSNTAADPSGYGEGETYLGSANVVSDGSGEADYSATLTGITGVTNLAMTTTEIDGSTQSGFGSTSEFGDDYERVATTDLSMEKQLLNPEDVAIGATLNYRLTVTNNSPSSIDLIQFDGSGVNTFATALILDFLPPELTYVSSSNADLTCTNVGAALSVIAPNHPGWNGIFCTYSGDGQVLGANDSISTDLEVTVADGSDLEFTNIAVAGAPAADPDSTGITTDLNTAFISGGEIDILELFAANGYNNFATAEYPVPQEQNEDPVVTDSDSEDTANLASSGSNKSAQTLLAVLMAATGLALLKWHSKLTSNESRTLIKK